MTPNDRSQFAELWIATYAVYDRKVTDGMLEVVFNALSAYSLQDIRRGLSGHVKNPDSGQFPPKPADVIKHIGGNSQSAGGEAWAKVDFAVRCIGHYRSVVFDDPKIHAAIIRLGGWQTVALTTEQEYPFLQNNFLKLYQGFTHHPPKDFPNKLIGASEQANSLQDRFERGKNKDQPALIGDPEKARMVYEGGGAQGVTEVNHVGTQAYLERLTDDIGKPALEHKP